MNIRRGLFRLWAVFASLFVIATGIVSTGSICDEFRKAASIKDASSFVPLLPIDCSQARGSAGSDYSSFNGCCWYEIRRVRTV